jgi:2-keto-4-pentenoate hydratase/2-oxohepta-3-ene-1,7-dioic acid hydratase in catechol pathway
MNYLFDNLVKTNQNKILCLAKNYLKHAIEMGAKDVPPYPVVFGKPWSSIIYEPNNIRINTEEGHSIDHEGKTFLNIS